MSKTSTLTKREMEFEINQFVQICDTIIDILKFGRKKHNQLCMQIGMIDKIWSCYPVHKAKVLQVLKCMCQESLDSVCEKNVEYLIKQHDALLQELSVIIRNEDKSISRELRYSAIALLTVLAGSENKIIKDQILEQHKYIQTLPKILIQETENDLPLKLVLVTAI